MDLDLLEKGKADADHDYFARKEALERLVKLHIYQEAFLDAHREFGRLLQSIGLAAPDIACEALSCSVSSADYMINAREVGYLRSLVE